jgi:hypothetical protein
MRDGRKRPSGQGSDGTARYLISFDDGAMDHISGEDLPDVGKAAHAVIQEAVNAAGHGRCPRLPDCGQTPHRRTRPHGAEGRAGNQSKNHACMSAPSAVW